MAPEGNSRRALGKALHIDGGRIEVVDTVGDGVVDQGVDRLLVDGIAVAAGVGSCGHRMHP